MSGMTVEALERLRVLLARATEQRLEHLDAMDAEWALRLTTLRLELSAGRIANLDRLTAALVADVASAKTDAAALAGRITTARGLLLDKLGTGVPAVKNVQRGVISIADNVASGSATVTAVNTAKSTLALLGQKHSASVGGTSNLDLSKAFGSQWASLVLTDATTVTAARRSSPGGSLDISWELTEYH